MHRYKSKDTHILWTIINEKGLFSNYDVYASINNM